VAALAVVLVAVIGVVVAARSSSNVTTRQQFIAGTAEAGQPVKLDTSLYLPESTPAPAILLAHGFGGTKDSVAHEANKLASNGYVVLTWTARGFGRSGGKIHLDQPNYEVADARKLIDYLSAQPQVDKTRIGVAGASYGGGLALLLAGYDKRIKAVAADITWNSLEQSLFPNGVFKKIWTGELFGNAFGDGGTVSCGRFAPDACAAYQDSARTGVPTPQLRALLEQASPATVLDRITAPTLLSQGEQDSLFPLSQADANARGIAATGTPVKVVWRSGGHDSLTTGSYTATDAALAWFDAVFHGGASGTQQFQIDQQSASQSGESDTGDQRRLVADGYPGVAGTRRDASTIKLDGPPQQIAAPAGGVPAAITSIPGLSGLFGRFASLSGGLSVVPGQTAGFVSPPLSTSRSVIGATSVKLTVTAQHDGDVTLFAALRDVGGGAIDLSALAGASAAPAAGLDAVGQLSGTLPAQLVSPVLLRNMKAGVARTVTVALPSIVYTVASGHRLVLTVSTTDFAYQNQQAPNTYTVALASNRIAVPTVSGKVVTTGNPAAWLITGAAACVLLALLVALELRRRRRIVKPDPDLAGVPVSIRGLVKEYAGGYRAVDDVTFRVEKGQVVGLLGPNGAGKTTALRVLVGLITPTKGVVHVFGEPVLPGAPVLARLGAFIEGPGFLPHLSGRDNLRLFWAATGRPTEEADLDIALDIAGLGASVDRKVKTYSHGMKQRLGIAQAMLGLPELLVLDEPTNGLDPPQIAEMREVMKRYADTGRTVVVSSHLLAEVEQTCTHVVVMHKGRLVAAGSVVEIAGADGVQLSVDDPDKAARVLLAAGIVARAVPARRALEDVFLDLIGADE
jgi:ABC-2 type transport system ATP-binding protein